MNVLNTTTTFQIDRHFFLRAIVQYDSSQRRVLTDFLASWELLPGTVAYAGYGSLIERREWDGQTWTPGRGPLPDQPARPVLQGRVRPPVLGVSAPLPPYNPCRPTMKVAERTVLAVLLAATLATLLLVARNGLAPVQHPLSFGLVFWAWVALLYSVVGAAALLVAAAASRLPGLSTASRWALFAATALFTAVALASNRRAVSSLFLLQGEARFRVLVPASAVLCAIALLAVGAPADPRARVLRWVALLAVAGGLLALVPQRPDDKGSRGRSAEARPQGLRFALVGVDGADWDLMEPLLARGDLPNLRAIKESGAWGRLETLRPTLSPAIWTSMVTGKRPRRHGVLDFTTRRLRGVEESLPGLHPLNRLGFPFLLARLEAAGQIFEAPITSFMRRVPAFWNVAAARGSPVSVVNWWGTWPAEPVVGDVVSERAYYHELLHRGQAAAEGGLTHPEDLYAEVAPLIVLPDDVTLADTQAFMDVTAAEFEPMRVKHPSRLTGIANEFTYFLSTFATEERLALHLLERSRQRYGQPADLLVLFRLVDKTCHTALVYSELVDEHPGLPRNSSAATEGWSARPIAPWTAPSAGSRRPSGRATSSWCPTTASRSRARKGGHSAGAAGRIPGGGTGVPARARGRLVRAGRDAAAALPEGLPAGAGLRRPAARGCPPAGAARRQPAAPDRELRQTGTRGRARPGRVRRGRGDDRAAARPRLPAVIPAFGEGDDLGRSTAGVMLRQPRDPPDEREGARRRSGLLRPENRAERLDPPSPAPGDAIPTDRSRSTQTAPSTSSGGRARWSRRCSA